MSDLISRYEEIIDKIAKARGIEPEERPTIKKSLEFMEKAFEEGEPFLCILSAPTGYGKTALSYTMALYSMYDSSYFEKLIHVLPLRSIVEDAYAGASEILPNKVGRQMMGVIDSPFFLFPLTFVTFDTFTYACMKLNVKKIKRIMRGEEYGYDYFTQASVFLSIIVLDEVHIFLEEKMLREALSLILELLCWWKVPLVLMTATPIRERFETLKRIFSNKGYEVSEFKLEKKEPFAKREAKKEFKITLEETKSPNDLLEGSGRRLIVVNSVKRAQEIYELTKRSGVLIHSRFTQEDRERKIRDIRRLSKDESDWIIVATQVIEAGVDISSDVLITELAPPTAIIQRMGRNARFYWESKGTIRIILPRSYHPYDEDLMNETFKNLKKISHNGRIPINPRLWWTYEALLKAYSPVGYDISDMKLSLLFDIRNPLERADSILKRLRKISEIEGFLREYPLPLSLKPERKSVGEIPTPAWLLEKIVERHPEAVEVREDGRSRFLRKEEIDEIRRKIASWEDVQLVLVKDELYDEDLGLNLRYLE